MLTKKTLYLIFLLLLIINISGCTSKNIAYYNVYGTITTEQFNSPIEGAKVVIADKNAITDSEGKYLIEDVRSGNYHWKVISNKYQNLSYEILINSDLKIDKKLNLKTGSTLVSGNINVYNNTGYSYKQNSTTTNRDLKININKKDKKIREDEIIVKYQKFMGIQSIKKAERKQGLEKMNYLNTKNGKLVKYKVPKEKTVEEMINYYNSLPMVEFAEPNYLVYQLAVPSDIYYNEQWGHIAVNLEAAWDIRKNSESITIAVIDSGIIPNHPDLQNQLLQGADFVGGPKTTDPSDYNVTDYDPTDESSDSSHGSHVAGIIGSSGNNEKGIAGVNWNTNLLPLRAIGADGTGDIWDVAESIYYVIDREADVINMSLGGPGNQTYHNAIKDAYDEDIIIVAAAGNDGAKGLIYPAAYDETIAVGAVDETNNRAYYSNYGPKLDLVAPGNHIYSTSGYYNNGNTVSNYEYMSGTSMATPYVSGVVALLLSEGVSPDNIKSRLISTAVDLGLEGKDDDYGYGLVDAYGALINKKLKNPYVFAANIENDNIYVKSEVKKINKDGSYNLNGVVNEKVYIIGWRDVNENQKIDGDDFYGRYSSQIDISENTRYTVNFDMYYVTEVSNKSMKVKGISEIEIK